MSQRRLPGIGPPDEIHPSEDRKQPVLWVRRLRVLRELAAGDEFIVRAVELRRGLNIVWAPPQESSENALFQNGVAGHTAGKTTFCRLLRYVLGEHQFAPEATRRRIRSQLSTYWVVADVAVNGEAWIIARPLGIGAHSFCIRGGAIDQVADGRSRIDYREFLNAIGSATTAYLSASRFPATDERISWDHLLPWLSRDQECRFADFLDWRHTASDSESPALTVDERQFVVRSVLGLISDEERLEQQRNADLVSRKRIAVQNEPLFAYQARTDHGRVRSALGKDLPAVTNPLFGSEARSEVNRLRNKVHEEERALSNNDRRGELRAAFEKAIIEQTNASRSLADLEARLNWERGVLAQLVGDSQTAMLAALPPPSGYCMVPMSQARDEHCPLAVFMPTDFSEHDERSAAQEQASQRRMVEALEARFTEYQRVVAAADRTRDRASQEYISAAGAFDEERGKLLEEKARLSHIARLVDEAETAWRKSSEQSDVIRRLDKEIDESYTRQEEIRSRTRDALEKFSNRFDYVTRAILGETVNGRVDTSGRSLALMVEEHGDRDSAAIATVKLLAFDLAALSNSVEGNGSFPRFLIHDGPREADMAPDIYERLFLFARELEKCFAHEPSFQYIVTTTTKPPEALLHQPWLRLQLSGIPTGDRFLRCDL